MQASYRNESNLDLILRLGCAEVSTTRCSSVITLVFGLSCDIYQEQSGNLSYPTTGMDINVKLRVKDSHRNRIYPRLDKRVVTSHPKYLSAQTSRIPPGLRGVWAGVGTRQVVNLINEECFGPARLIYASSVSPSFSHPSRS